MSDLKMKLITNNDLRLKMKSTDSISMKFDDYQKFKEEDPIFKDSPAYTITYNDIESWNNKSDFSGNYNDLTNKPNLSNFATYTYVNSELSNKVDKVEGMGLSQNSFTTEEKNKLESLENYDDSEIREELSEKADTSDIPTKTSDLTNDSGYITKDVDDLTYYPTITSFNAGLAEKQNLIDNENMLSADLVDDTSATNKFVTASDINTWNNKSDFSGDYDDLIDKPTIPTKTSELTNDSGFITKDVNDLTNYTLSSALSSVATTGSYNDLSNKPSIPNIDVTEVNASDYITISSSFTLASGSPKAYKSGNLVFFNYDITDGTINNGETALGTCSNKLVATVWGTGRCMEAYPSTNLCPASLIAIPSGAFRIYTTKAGKRSAGTIILLVNS